MMGKSESRPDWSYWCKLPSVSLWEAVALSLDLDPQPMDFRQNVNWPRKNFPNASIEKTYHNRLRVLEAHLSNENFFSANALNKRDPKVNLSEFAAWSLSPDFEWKIPPKLRALAKKKSLPITAAPLPAVEPGTKPTLNWILKVQCEAARRWASLKGSGANPTKYSLKDDLSKWCADNNVKTTRGITPSGDYIVRHALRSGSACLNNFPRFISGIRAG